MNKTTLSENDELYSEFVEELIKAYSGQCGGIRPDFYVKNRPDGPYLILQFALPSERNHKILNNILENLSSDNPLKDRVSIRKRKSSPKERLLLAETQLLRREISQSLTFDRNSFSDDFFSRYTPSVSGLEQQITANANYVVYGRRGAGKSSLLAYAMHSAIAAGYPYSWVAMQAYANRSDLNVVPAVLSEILYDLNKNADVAGLEDLIAEFDVIESRDEGDVISRCNRIIQRTRRVIGGIAKTSSPLTIFLDDIHVISESIQPLVLGFVYKVTRGNNAFIKISGITQLTKLWDGAEHMGLQATQDAQLLNLDHNLTMPDKSKEHIISILDAHARYCGLPNVRYLADDSVISRLVLVAAGVPRDSLNLFSVAIAKAIAKSQKLVSITSINAAASEMAEEKLKDVERDSGGDLASIQGILSEVKAFCISRNKKNAFLVEIDNSDSRYRLVQKLAALRLVHILHEGITPHEAGKRYVALMLDYGFYVGIRAARSVDLIPDTPRSLSARELRSLPIFKLEAN